VYLHTLALYSDPNYALVPIMLVNFTLLRFSEQHISTESLQKDRYEQALAYFNDGKTIAALKKSEAALKEYPGDANLMCLAAKANLVLKRFGKARRLIDEAVRQHPGFAVAHDLIGDLLLIQGHAESAVKAYEQAIRLDPTRSLVLAKIEKALELAASVKKSLPSEEDTAPAGRMPFENEIRQAKELHESGKPAGAEKIYRDILKHTPGQRAARVGQARGSRKNLPRHSEA